MIDIKAIWDNQLPTGDVIVKTRIKEIKHLKCYLATDHITGAHLYIMSFSKKIDTKLIKELKFKGVNVFISEDKEHNNLNILLIDNSLKDIFIHFIQNILDEIKDSVTEKEAIDTTLNILVRWKRLFDSLSVRGLTKEQQKGLIGELLFMNFLIESKISEAETLNSWTGPDGEDKDFRFGANGIEVKLTSSKRPRLKITNEGQLDNLNLSSLFIILYAVEKVKDKGVSLNTLVDNVRKYLANNTLLLKFFNDRLMLIGYFDDDREYYNDLYSIVFANCYNVDDDFPRIIKDDLPNGIYDASYHIEISSVENFQIEFDKLIEKIK